LQLAAARLESGKTFDASQVGLKPDTTTASTPRDSQSPSICQVFVKSSADRDAKEHTDCAPEAGTNSQDDQDLQVWLGGRDSNPARGVLLIVDGAALVAATG
jgi:hypothetical protein